MNIIQKIKWEAGRMFLKNEMKNLRRRSVAMGYSDAFKIGILYNATEKENYEAVKNFVRRIRNNSKEVTSLGFINSRKFPSDQFIKLGIDFFTLGDMNWYYKPTGKKTSNFVKTDLDILICLTLEECLPIDYLVAFSNAKFKIGRFSERNKQFFDFMIDLKPGEKISEFVQQTDHYLQLINEKPNSK